MDGIVVANEARVQIGSVTYEHNPYYNDPGLKGIRLLIFHLGFDSQILQFVSDLLHLPEEDFVVQNEVEMDGDTRMITESEVAQIKRRTAYQEEYPEREEIMRLRSDTEVSSGICGQGISGSILSRCSPRHRESPGQTPWERETPPEYA